MKKQKNSGFISNQLKLKAFSWSFVGLSVSLSCPIELVRFRMQVMPELISMGRLGSPYLGIVDCIKRIASSECIQAFWKGNMSNLMRVVPTETMVFTLKEQMHKRFHYGKQLSSAQHVFMNSSIGVLATFCIALALYPFEYVRLKLASRTEQKRSGIIQEMKKAVRKSGVFELYHGVNLLMCGILCFRGTFFGLYDSLKVKTQDERVRFLYCYLSMFPGLLAAFPIDCIRRRKVTNREKYKGVVECAKSIYESEGVAGFYRGWQMLWFQSVAWSCSFFFYDRLFTDYKAALDM